MPENQQNMKFTNTFALIQAVMVNVMCTSRPTEFKDLEIALFKLMRINQHVVVSSLMTMISMVKIDW
jgi:hypothetical protein